MSIADKLVTITENEQRVYDSGYEKGRTDAGGGDDVWLGFLNTTETHFVLPEGTTKLKSGLFWLSPIVSVTLPDSVTVVGQYACNNCTSLQSMNLPDGITAIGNYAFPNCYRWVVNNLPSELTSIGQSAFSDCYQLKITEIPEGVTTIGASAFYSCIGLTSITFKGTPTSIGANAFLGCANLKTINVPWSQGAVAGENTRWGATNATIIYDHNPDATVFYLDDGTEWAFERGMTWADFIESSYNVGRAFGTADFDTDGNGTMIDVVTYIPSNLFDNDDRPVELSSAIDVGGYYYRA